MKRLVTMLFNNYSTRACWVRYFIWLRENICFNACTLVSNVLQWHAKTEFRFRFVSHTGDSRTPSEKGIWTFTSVFRFPTNCHVKANRFPLPHAIEIGENSVLFFIFLFRFFSWLCTDSKTLIVISAKTPKTADLIFDFLFLFSFRILHDPKE